MSGLKFSDPMKNDVVLQRIFDFCDVPSLKKCRLVSTKWRDLSLKAWRDKAMIQLGPRDQKVKYEEFLNMIDADGDDGNVSLQLRNRPFKCYSVQFDECDPEDDEDDFLEQNRAAVAISNCRAQFVKIVWEAGNFNGFGDLLSILNSDTLVSLEVTWYTLDNDIPEPIVPKNSSKLKRLKLFTRSIMSDHVPNRSLWFYLLSCFPKLEALSVGYGTDVETVKPNYSVCLDERLRIVSLLKVFRESGGESRIPLKELEMMNVYTNPEDYEQREKRIIDTLADCKFPLERLSIHVGWDGGDEMPLLPLLKSSRTTLQYLKASINFNNGYYNGSQGNKSILKHSKSGKIHMEALKEAFLVNGLEWAMFLLSHLETPELEKLIVKFETERNPYHRDRYGPVAVVLPKGKVYQRLETFELHDNADVPDPKLIKKFGKMMPNLTHLKIPLDKASFIAVCEHFRGLKTLHVLPGQGEYVEIDDEAVTGISRGELKKGGFQSGLRRTNITNLEHLSDLRICCRKQLQREDVKFTENSVIYGFLQLPRLYNLSVAMKNLSVKTKEKLVAHLKGNVYFQQKSRRGAHPFSVEIISEDESSDVEESDCGTDTDSDV